METFMNLRRILWFSLVSANLAQAALGQSFVNLNFEDATVPTVFPGGLTGGDVDPALAFPGWTVGNSLNGRLYVGYNAATLGAPSVELYGPNNDFQLDPLQGSFTAQLEYYNIPSMGLPTLSQTGLVPAGAQSINFLVGGHSPTEDAAAMMINGVTIPLVPISGGRMAADISSFAGQVVQLTFTTSTDQHNNLFYFDDIQFSASPVPEPSTFAQAALGAPPCTLSGALERISPLPRRRSLFNS
jgi:hypothetical protein